MVVDVEALQRENAAQRAQIAELISTSAQLMSTNAKLAREIAKLNDRVAELLVIAQRKQRKTSSPAESKPAAPPPNVEPAAQKAFRRAAEPARAASEDENIEVAEAHGPQRDPRAPRS